MVIDRNGYRLNVGIILVNTQGRVFLGKRIGQDTWQFPQGGIHDDESAKETMLRELHEEIGLDPDDVVILGVTKGWLKYRLPSQFIRRNSDPTVIGQKQKWYLLKLVCSEQKLRLNLSLTPEFDSWRWVDYWYPVQEVIYFKQPVYRRALRELKNFLPVVCEHNSLIQE